MSIKKEHKVLLKQVSSVDVAIKRKEQLEELVERELSALKKDRTTLECKLHSLRDQGILYCEKCNGLYEMSETKLVRKEGQIVVGSVDLDPERSRNIYAHGVELSYYCPKCDKYLTGEIRT